MHMKFERAKTGQLDLDLPPFGPKKQKGMIIHSLITGHKIETLANISIRSSLQKLNPMDILSIKAKLM